MVGYVPGSVLLSALAVVAALGCGAGAHGGSAAESGTVSVALAGKNSSAERPTPTDAGPRPPLEEDVGRCGVVGGAPSREPWLGVEMATPTAGGGVLVRAVLPGSPALRAGLEAGDRLLLVDGVAVSEPSDVAGAIAAHAVSDEVSLSLLRGDAERLLRARLDSRPSPDAMARGRLLGAPAPELGSALPAHGGTAAVSPRSGRLVLVDFWAPWCSACHALVPHLNELHRRLRARGLQVVGVTATPVLETRQAAARFRMDYPSLADESGEVSDAYGATAVPMLVLIDDRGVVREVLIGYSRSELDCLEGRIDALLGGG